MTSLIAPFLVSLAGAVAIALIAALLLAEITKSPYNSPRDRYNEAEYKWMAFSITMRISAALAASIYGLANAADIIDARTTVPSIEHIAVQLHGKRRF